MGGGASRAKASAKKQILQATTYLADGDLEKALEICKFMFETKVVGLSEKDSIKTSKEISKIEDELLRLQKILTMASTEAEGYMAEGDKLLREQKLEEAKEKYEAAAGRYQKALLLDCGARGEAWSRAHHKRIARPNMFKKHDNSLTVKGRKVVCMESEGVGSAFVNQEISSGILIAEFRIVQSKGDDPDMFFGVVKPDLGTDDFWYDEDCNDKAWFLSNDGDLCNGENELEGMDSSQWKLHPGDTVRMQLEFPGRGMSADDEVPGQLTFWKNGSELPKKLFGMRGRVCPAVCMSDCLSEDCVEVIDIFYNPDPSPVIAVEDENWKARPIVRKVLGALVMCQAAVLFVDFQIPAQKIILSNCRNKMREAIAATELAGEKAMLRTCRSWQMELFGKLKDEMMSTAALELQNADSLVEEGKLTNSFPVYDKAIRLLSKVEETSLAKHAQKQRQAAVSRRDVSARTADRNMKIVRSKIKAIDVAVLPGGYQDCIDMTTESATLFQQAGDQIKAKDAEQWIEISKQMQAASEACVSGNEAMERAKETGAAYHYQKANNFFSESGTILSDLGNPMFAAEMKKMAYFALEALDVLKGDNFVVREGSAADQMEGAMQDYAEALDGKDDEDEPDAGSVDPILTGDLSKLLNPRSNTFSVYVSSSFVEHPAERKCLAEMVSVTVRDAVNRYGYEFEFVDPQIGLRARKEVDHDFAFQERCSYLIKQCAKESMGVDYLALVGQDENGMAFPGHIDFDMFNRVIKGIPDRGEHSKIRRVILDWFHLDTNTNPRRYVMADKFVKIPALKSADKRKRDLGWQEWVRVFGMMHRGFYEACVQDIENKQRQLIRMGIMGKIGDLDSYGMKQKVKELFDEIDQDNSGEVDKMELQQAFEKLDVFLSLEKVEAYMSDFDDDGSGTIEFEEFLLMVERMLKDAKENLKSENNQLDTSHCKYFMQSLLFQEVSDGMLDRPDASSRTAAVLWGFDPAMPGRELHVAMEPDESDAIAAIRAQHLKERGKEERVEDQLEMKRPEWMQPEPVWVLKSEIFKKHCAGVAERAALEGEEEGSTPLTGSRPVTGTPQPNNLLVVDDEEGAQDESSEAGFADEEDSTLDVDQSGVTDQETADGISRPEILDILLMRKTALLRILPHRSIEQLAQKGNVIHLETAPGKPEPFVKQHERAWDSASAQAARWKCEELEGKISKLEERRRTLRNAADQRAIETQVQEMQIDVRALKADLDQAMYIVLEGETSVWNTDPKTGRGKKLANLKVGDGFGDLTLAVGYARDSTIMLDSRRCKLLELKKGSVETIIFRQPHVERRLKELLEWRKEDSLRTHFLTYAIPEIDSHMRYQVLLAMRTFRSPLIPQLLPEEVNALAKRCCVLQLETPTCLFRQDDSSETGWGQFGESFFVLLSGELHVSILVEKETGETEELEVLRLVDNGDAVGELSITAQVPRTCTVRTHGKCVLAEITFQVFHEEVTREGVAERLFEAIMDREAQGKIVEAHVLNSRVQYALRLRRSNMLKLLSDIEIDFLAAVSSIQERRRGERVVEQGSEGCSLFVVVRGEMKLMVAFADGEAEREIARLQPGDSIGEMAMILGEPYASTVQISSSTCLLAEVEAHVVESLLEARSDIVDQLQAMAYGDGGGGDVLRARTPLGGRAATPGGVAARGLTTSQNIVTYPWVPKKKALHVDEQGGPKYLASLAHKVSHALLGSIDTALHKHHKERAVDDIEIIEEAAFHGQMAVELTRTFAGREEELVRLVDYIDGDYSIRMGLRNQPTIVLAEPGVGKSALLAKAGMIAKTRFPGSTMVFKFIGWSEQTLNSAKMVQSIIRQISCTLGLSHTELPHSAPELRTKLEELLANAAKGELISLVLDAVDQLETPQGFDPNFDWLPRLLPRYSSIILSLKSTSPAVVAGLNQIFTGEVYFRVYALHPSKATKVLENKLAIEGRSGFQNDQFESIRVASLASAGLEGTPLNCSPIFLKMAMCMADTWYSFEPAKQLPTSVPDLMVYALDRTEEEHGRMLVERACGYLMISRDGLTRQELMDMLSCDDDVVEDVFGVQVPDFRRIPGFTGALLFRALEMLIGRRAAQLVPVWNIRHSAFVDVLNERYGLGQKHVIMNFHMVFAKYFSEQWVDGKEIWKDWKPKEQNSEKFQRGVRKQPVYLDGESTKLLHRGTQITNSRRMRELPHHVCWMSGRTTAVDPIARTLQNRPPTSWNDRMEYDRTGQMWFQKYMCSLEVIEAACSQDLAFELAADFLLARKIFPYSDPIREFQKLLGDKAEVLADFPSLTFQCALNASGSGQTSVNEVAAQVLDAHVQGEEVSVLPPCWLVHTNKNDMMDPLAAKFHGHFGAVFCVTISNRDDIVVTAGADCTVRLFDATSANELRRMDAHQEAVKRCCFSPDNAQILSVSSDCIAILWDLLKGDVLMRLDGHEGEVLDCAFLTQTTVVTASNDCKLQTWDLKTGKSIKFFEGHEDAVTTCLPMSRGTQLLSASYDRSIRVWDVQTAEQLLVMAGHTGVIYGMALSADEKRLVSCSAEEVIKVWDLDLGEEVETLHLHTGAILCCALDRTGAWVVTGSSDHSLRLYEFGKKGSDAAVVVGKHDKAICSVVFTHDGQYILSAGADGVVSKWEWLVAHQVATDDTPDHTCPISHIELSSDGMFCISLSTDGAAIIRVLDWEGNALGTHQLTDQEEPAAACRFSPHGKSVATLHSFGTLLWDSRTGALIGRFAQEFDLMSLNFPEDIDYGVAPPLSPIVSPKTIVAPEEDEKHQQVRRAEEEKKEKEVATSVVGALSLFGGSEVADSVSSVPKNAEDGTEHQTGTPEAADDAPSGTSSARGETDQPHEEDVAREHALPPFPGEAEVTAATEDDQSEADAGAPHHSDSKHSELDSRPLSNAGQESGSDVLDSDDADTRDDKSLQRSLERLPTTSIRSGHELDEVGASEMAMGSKLGLETDADDPETGDAGAREQAEEQADTAPADDASIAEEPPQEEADRPGVQRLVVSTPPHVEEWEPPADAERIPDPGTQTLRIDDNATEDAARDTLLARDTPPALTQFASNSLVPAGFAEESPVQSQPDPEQADGVEEAGSRAPLTTETPLWQFSVLLAEMDGKYEPGEESDDDLSISTLKEADEGKGEASTEQSSEPDKGPPEVFDSDRPDYAVDMETVQRILHTLDKLDATTDPKSALFGQTPSVLGVLANNKLCRRNIAIPARGIPSLNFLVLETIVPYLRHPEEETVLAAITAVSKLTKPGHKVVMSELERLFKSELSAAVKTAAVTAVAAIAVSQDIDEEEEMRNKDIRKILTVTVVAAKGLIAADASGLSDPFAMIQLEPYDAAKEELNAFRAQDVSKHRNMEAGPAKKIFNNNPELLDLAVKMCLMRKARLLELLSEAELRDLLPHCNFVSINKDNLLTFQADPNPSMFLVLSGLLRVMVKFDMGKTNKKKNSRGRRASVLLRSRADKNFRKQGTIKGLMDYDFGQQIALLGRGDTIGELPLALQQEFPATVIANQDAVLIQFTQDTFKFLRTMRPDVADDVQEEARRALNISSVNDGPKNIKKTDVKRKTLNPIWDETFVFHNLDVDSSLVVTLYDHDIVGSHDFLGQVRIDVMSLPLNQDFEGWFRCEARVAEEVTGELQLKMRLETDKRPRILLNSGETLVSTVKRSTLEVQKDVAAGEGDQAPLTLFRLDHEITSWNVSPADPRIIALGDKEGRVHIVRVQDRANYKAEAEYRLRDSEDQAARSADASS